jgi:hypothetical protein
MKPATETRMGTPNDTSFQTLSAHIRAAWAQDSPVSSQRESLDVVAGDPPAVAGEVADVMVKRRAARLAREAASGSEIADHITVHADPPVPDTLLARRALDLISRHRAFLYISVTPWEPTASSDLADWIGVDVQAGEIVLHGRVGSLTHRRLAEVLAWRLPGCRDVLNLLHVDPPQQDNDGEITDAAEQALRIVLGPNAERVSVTTRLQKVTLSGVVDSASRHHLALEVCWSIPGVHWVDDNLSVRHLPI